MKSKEPWENVPRYLDPFALWRRLSREFRLAFCSALVMGFITHLYVFSNLLINHDGLLSLNSNHNALFAGRWAEAFFNSLSWSYEMPAVIGLLTVLAMALGTGLTVRVLELRSPACILLTAGFMTAFPAVASAFSYLFLADSYLISMALAAAAVYLTKRFRFGWAAAALCLALSLGIYQAYIGCAVGLFLFDCMLALFSGTPVKDAVKRGIGYIAVILAGLALYRLLLAFFLWKSGVALYYSADISLMDCLRAVPKAYRQLLSFLWKPSYLIKWLVLAQRVMFLLAGASGLFLIVFRRLYREPVRLLLLLCGGAMLPPALNLISIISTDQKTIYILMQYSYVLAFVFALKVFELTAGEALPAQWPSYCGRLRHGAALAGLALCAALVWANVCLSNAVYFSMELYYESSQSIGVRILDRLENMEGYVQYQTPVMLVDDHPSTRYAQSFPQLSDMVGAVGFSQLGSYAGPHFLSSFCGGKNRFPTQEQLDDVRSSGIVDSMPAFPNQGFIQFYNGVAVVKVS